MADTWPVPRTMPQPGVFEAAKADSTQSFVAVGHQGELLRTNPDYVPVQLMNEVLSGGFTSRLFGKIRTELGLAYSVGGGLGANWTRVAPFQMQMSTRADATVRAIETLVAEAKLLATTKPATDAELKLAKDSILNSFVFNNDEAAEVLGQQLAYEYYGQPLDWLDRYRAAVDKVTAADVARVAAKYIHPDRLSIVIVGPSEGRDKPLSALGTVKAIDLTIPPPPSAAPVGAGASAGKPAMAPSGAAGAAAGSPQAADAKAKGQALLGKVVEGVGGAAVLDGVKSYVAEGEMTVKTPQGEFTLKTKETMVMPDRFRQDMTLPMGQMAIVIAGPEAFMAVAAGRAGDAGLGAPAGRGSARARAAAAAPAAQGARLRSDRGRRGQERRRGDGAPRDHVQGPHHHLRRRSAERPHPERLVPGGRPGWCPRRHREHLLGLPADRRPDAAVQAVDDAERGRQRDRDDRDDHGQRRRRRGRVEAEGRHAMIPGHAAAAAARSTPMAAPAAELSIVVVLPPGIVPEVGYAASLRAAVATLGCSSEIVVIASPRDAAAARQAWPDATIEDAPGDGYGVALVHGLRRARGEWALLVDADLREPGPAVVRLWAARDQGEILIGSRFAPGAALRVPALRRGLSRALNRVFRRGLSLGVADLSSATRLIRRKTLAAHYDASGYDILQELLVRAYADGWKVVEVPIDYEPAHPGAAYPRALGVGADYLRRFWALWKLRNSILAADYDDRAHDSAIWLQRYWQRQRFKHITELVEGEGRVLDVGCGSSRIIGALVKNSVCIDILRRKLRYDRKFGRPLVHGSGFTLPVPDASFPCVLCSQVIEHVPKESPILEELDRALAPGGRLVLGTPDYSRWEWVVTEKLYGMAAPGAYADEHIGHYTREELIARYTGMGWTHEATRYILRGELILAFRKPRG